MKHKIYLSALLLLLMHLPTLAQIGGDYNPSNPGDPGTPVLKYTLTLKAIPTDGGSFSVTSTKVSVGENYNIRAYANTDFVFEAWICDGDTISKSASYNITMPDHDVEITGVFRYDPSSPGDPQEQALKYQLSLRAEPVNSGSFNINNERLAVGSVNTLRAYTNTDFVFKHWRIGDSILSTSQNMNFTMPAHNVEIIGQFEYNPANPGNPNANYWNPLTGEVIVDDFTPGYLSDAISTLLSNNNANRNDVQMITVAGVMTSNDFGIVNNYTNCTILDISRVTGVTEVPSYAFDYTNLESVYLPATIEKIGNSAFYQCTKLSSLTVYAMTPPQLGSNVFYGVPEGLVVYVPAAAIAQYQDDPNWSKYIILPIQEDIRTLTVNLPAGANPIDYTNMWLELTNTKNGQRMHYVMDNRTSYKFNNIIRNTTWDVVLRNPNGDIFGKIENVEVGDEDVTVTFASLSKPYTVTISVLTPTGQDVTSQTEITWTDVAGNYISQESSVAGLPVGYQLAYNMKLSQELAMTYNVPAEAQYTVKNGSNAIVCRLTAISKVSITGKVKDAATGLPLNGANITASQTFGGKYDQTMSTKSDGNGDFLLEVAQVPTVIAASASDYISKTIDCDVTAGTGVITLPDVMLDPITGATIAVDFTFTPSHNSDEEAETQNWYSDYNNVDYAIFNKTKNRTLNQFSAQYPQIVLLEDVSDGDVLELTATSRKSTFIPVKTTVTIAGQKANATFNIIELGKISASFKKNSNPKVVGTLYDANGKLLDNYDYNDASLTIDNLSDGNYTLITMGDSQFFNTIYDIEKLSQTGLISGVDYVRSTVEVKSGLISNVEINNVPLLDESKLYYTGENTSFTVNKPSIVIGNYLTMTGHIDFKPAYATQVENVSMIVDIPESCSFVENSVMVGNSTGSYTINGNQITIPMIRYTDRVRFCVIPTVGGDYAPSAFVQFDLSGKTIKQPIGAANYTAQELSINVPSTVAKASIPVSGTAIGQCDIDIYDNDVLIAQTTSLANGTWTCVCDLNKPYNLSNHSIYAKVMTKAGLMLSTEVKECAYDQSVIEAKTITMTFYNGWMKKNIDVVFDLQNKIVTPTSYSFYTGTDFTFVADLTNNDTTIVTDVKIKVYTDHRNWRTLPAHYDSNIDKWVAVSHFESDDLPVGLKVKIFSKNEVLFDNQYLIECNATLQNDGIDLVSLFELSDSIYDEIKSLDISQANYEERFDEYINSMLDSENWRDDLPEIDVELTESAIQRRITEIRDSLLIDDQLFDIIHSSFLFDEFSSFIYDNFEITKESCDDFDISLLSNYSEYRTTDNGVVYIFANEEEFDFIDLLNNQRIHLKLNARGFRANVPEEGGIRDIWAWIDKLSQISLQIGLKLKPIEEFIRNAAAKVSNLSNRLAELERYAQYYKANGLEASYESVQDLIAKTSKDLSKAQRYLSFLKALERALPILNAVQLINQMQGDLKDLINLYFSVPDPCPDDQEDADRIKRDIIAYGVGVGAYAVGQAALCATEIGALIPSIAAATATLGTSILIEAALIAAQVMSAWAYERGILHKKEEFRSRINALKCKNPDDDDDDDDDDDEPHPKADPIHDPSGFVYEGVPSNRLQGVTTTCFYKETVADMYGDLHDEVVLWDATQYGQENPLFTDENGYYRWDVPVGLWQVKYEKAGYETTYSDWLPVPPPQLDVNIGMVQMRQPEVVKARAYTKAVEFEFDKYMKPESLTTGNITVLANGEAVDGTVQLLNDEHAYDSDETYASRVRFNAASPFNADEVTLHVCHKVESYAGLRMSDDYEQTLTVEYEMEKIDVDTTIYVLYGDSRELTVTVLPAMASRGKTLEVHNISPMILSIDAENYALDKNGQAVITVHGDLPGMGSLVYCIDGYDLTAATLVNVLMEEQMNVAKPTASVASGSEVHRGTAVYLRCATEGATIYYTLDGSCPCDNTPARKIYDGNPIIINSDVTIKAMATAEGLYDSEVATFTYKVSTEVNGDVNRDGEVNIADVNAVIDVILSSNVNSDVKSRADANGDGEVNIADINAIIDIILNLGYSKMSKVNCDDLLHIDDVTMKPGDVRTVQVTLDNAIRFSAMQCDIVLPEGLTLVDVHAMGANTMRTGSLDDTTCRLVNYSPGKLPFVGNSLPLMTFTVRADAALASESEITLTNIVLADAANKAWCTADAVAHVNNASGVDDLTAYKDRIWAEKHTLRIEARLDGIARIASVNGMVREISVKAGVTSYELEPGIYVVVFNGKSHKIAIK